MIDGLKPYAAMKDSGVPWLGEVPEHWRVLPNRAVFAEVNERDRPEADMLSVTITRGVIRQKALLEDSSKKDSSKLDKSAYKVVRPGDIAYNKMRAWQGALGVSKYEGIVSPAYVVQRPREGAAPHYLHYLLRTPAFAKEAERWSYGITSDMWTLRPEHFKMIYSCLPPLPEQSAIVRFLDHADRRIRRYIRAKQKLIKLLEEQKHAIIHRAVTRGLDPNVRLKPSGVEWLGDVPEHWEVARLGRLIELVTGFPFKSDGFTQDAKDIRLLRGVNISPGKIRWTDVVRWPLSERGKYSAFELQIGDIVLGMDRPLIQSGTRVATVTEPDVPALLLQRVARIRPRDELQSEFLMLLLAGKSFADYLTPIFTGISVPHLSPEQIKSFCFALPTDNEQRQLVRWTAEKTRKTDVIISMADREIQLLREYRTRLIADVVTGKLDVREAAARLPTDAPEPEALDQSEMVDDIEGTAPDDAGSMAEEAQA
ncbi:MAG: restriction endonuclease subunit S [Pseudomonadota bacterium]